MERSRAERLISNAEGLDAIVILNDGVPFLDSTFWYLTELTGGSFEGSMAVIGKGGDLNVIVSVLEEETASSGRGNICVYHNREERDNFLKEALKGAGKVGFNTGSASYAMVEYVKKTVKGIKIADARSAISSTVSVKDRKEIESTRKACKISSQVAGEIPGMLSEGVTEKEIAFRIDMRMRELGGTGNAFDTISAFGANSSKPHHSPTDHKLGRGDTALFDFGTKYDRYCSDMTRTVFLSRPPEILERAYEIVLEAQAAGIEKYKDGAPAKDADLAAREIIDATEFKGKFIHSFGHGIGMEVHQDISVSPKSEQILKEGNIVSAEPGIYIPGVGGIRIEDTCLITNRGCERLTDFDRRITFV
ncbi:MAG: aminopeptidase P family protein [Candidatus Methanoplasma sp.]|jgi:Xaa-Pro dipeptidase|nr:aminopeptidase P family protein [Candidatus Methanoplasma sp.]